MENCYKTLGVHKGSSEDEVKAAFRVRAKQNHPDLHADVASAERMVELNMAYSTLKERRSKQDYDKLLAILYPECAACSGSGTSIRQRGFHGKEATACAICDGAGRMVPEG